MDNKRSYTVTIYGDQYNLVTDESETHLYQAAAEVDRLMHSCAEKTNRPDMKKIAVLIALQVVCKNITLEKSQKDESLACKTLIDSIDRQISSVLSVE